MQVSASFIRDLKLIDRHLSVAWVSSVERFVITWTDPRTKVTKCVLLIEDENGDYRPPDRRALLFASQRVAWNTLYKYPDMKDLWNHLEGKRLKKLSEKRKQDIDYRKWWNKEHRKEWRAALENAKRGIFSKPEERENKIIIIGGSSNVKNHESDRMGSRAASGRA